MRAVSRPAVPALAALCLLAACGQLTDEEAAATEVQLAVAVEEADAVLTFGADWSEGLTGELSAGATVALDYAGERLPDCRGYKYGQPAWSILAFWRVDGGELNYTVVGGPSAPVAPELPAIELPATGELELWFTNNDIWGCVRWDSDFGSNYTWDVTGELVEEPEEPTEDLWIGNGAWVISRPSCDGLPCPGSGTSLDEAFWFGTWARQRATLAGVYFEVWKQGVTDWDNPDLWQQLDVRIHHRWAGETDWSWDWLPLLDRVDNNARYAASLWELDPYGWPLVMEEGYCPPQLVAIQNDTYVQSTLEYYLSANGVALRPADGGAWTGAFVDYAGAWEHCLAG